jgi:hypothetical protein
MVAFKSGVLAQSQSKVTHIFFLYSLQMDSFNPTTVMRWQVHSKSFPGVYGLKTVSCTRGRLWRLSRTLFKSIKFSQRILKWLLSITRVNSRKLIRWWLLRLQCQCHSRLCCISGISWSCAKSGRRTTEWRLGRRDSDKFGWDNLFWGQSWRIWTANTQPSQTVLGKGRKLWKVTFQIHWQTAQGPWIRPRVWSGLF